MRCPKCGYISFDHLENCLKCKKPIKGISNELTGAVHNVAVPTFLRFGPGSDEEAEAAQAASDFVDTEDMLIDDEISDPDLDILLDEEERETDEISFDFSVDDESGDEEITLDPGQGIDFNLPDDDEVGAEASENEGELSLDFSDFEFDSEELTGDGGEDEADERPALVIEKELPPELSDISDLDKPAPAEVAEQPADAEDDADLDLNLDLDLDLDFGLAEDDEAAAEPVGQRATATVSAEAQEEKSELEELSLDDLDLSLDLSEPESEEKPAKDKREADEELSFDLDLGDLDLDLK